HYQHLSDRGLRDQRDPPGQAGPVPRAETATEEVRLFLRADPRRRERPARGGAGGHEDVQESQGEAHRLRHEPAAMSATALIYHGPTRAKDDEAWTPAFLVSVALHGALAALFFLG